jgi:hypothetical protein
MSKYQDVFQKAKDHFKHYDSDDLRDIRDETRKALAQTDNPDEIRDLENVVLAIRMILAVKGGN